MSLAVLFNKFYFYFFYKFMFRFHLSWSMPVVTIRKQRNILTMVVMLLIVSTVTLVRTTVICAAFGVFFDARSEFGGDGGLSGFNGCELPVSLELVFTSRLLRL